MPSNLPFPLPDAPVAFPCDTAGRAIKLLQLAREHCLRASYFPAGGDARTHYQPVTHTVWIMGDPQNIISFRTALIRTSENSHANA